MNVALDCVAFVADDESRRCCQYKEEMEAVAAGLHDGFEILPYHCTDFLGCQLEGAVTNE